MKKLLLWACLLCSYTFVNAQLNVTLKANMPFPGKVLSNIGSYAANGKEYALVGTETGLSIVDVTVPTAPVNKFDVVGPTSDWREVKTWGSYAYVTTEGGNVGLQIVNLSYLPDSIQVKTWKGSGAIANQINTIHALHIDAGYVYLYGTNLANGGPIIASLSDPWNPVYLGQRAGSYVHDGYVRNDTLWACHINAGYFSAIDVSNKANPILLNTQNTPLNFTHNSWLNTEGSALFTTDEKSNTHLTAYDVRNINNITELGRVQSQNPGSNSIVHNTHIRNDYAITSWYKDGVVIHDVSRPDNMILVGWFDTSPQSGDGFAGCWGVDPFLPSGNLVVSDIELGLYVLAPNYIRGCYLEGIVTDSTTSFPINNALVEILSTSASKSTKITGVYKTGLAAAGSYSVRISKPGYITKTFNNVNLVNGVLTTLNVQLATIGPPITVSGNVYNAITNQPVASAPVVITNSGSTYNVSTDAGGNFSIPGFIQGDYDVAVGHWGYVTYCVSQQAITSGSGSVSVALQPGYYDDFAFDFGWTEAGSAATGKWVRGVPIGTTNGNSQANPGVDVTGDCLTQCYITGNGGGGAGTDDVDDGNTVLTSPVFNLTGNADPGVDYYRWFYNGGGGFGSTPNDTLTVTLHNGITSAVIERVVATTTGNSSWVFKNHRVLDYLTPTANMTITFEAADWTGSGHIVEAGVDAWKVIDIGLGLPQVTDNKLQLQAFPNPFNGDVTVHYSIKSALQNDAQIVVINILGKEVESRPIRLTQGSVVLGAQLPQGIYMVRLKNGSQLNTIKVVKAN